FILGATELRNEHYDEALDAFTFAIERNPEFEAAYKFRASAYMMLEDFDRAMEDANKALELDDAYADAYVERAAIYRARQEWDAALADLDKAIAADEEDPEPFVLKGKTLYDAGRYAEAITTFNEVLEEDTKNVDVLASRGLAYFFEGQPEDALADIKKARRLEGGSTVSEFNMGLVMSALPEHAKQAYRHFEKAFKKDRKILVKYVEMSKSHESERLLSRLDEILRDMEGRKDENYYTGELYDLLSRRLSEAKEAAQQA
ncbi:MAG: tetratricopeptide repeat protein, partial [Cyclonatronaceae bacterium]